jgi:hypothetical protein
MVGRATGLDWVETCVLRAAGDEALYLWDRRLSLGQVEARLARATQISRQKIEDALRALSDCGYLYADAAPGNPETLLQLMPKGLEEYCYRFVQAYGRISRDVLSLVCQDEGADVVELAHRSGQPELLVEHVLDVAEGRGLLRLDRIGHYVVVREVRPHLRRWVSGAA